MGALAPMALSALMKAIIAPTPPLFTPILALTAPLTQPSTPIELTGAVGLLASKMLTTPLNPILPLPLAPILPLIPPLLALLPR